MRVVRLNGELGKKYGRVHKLDIRTPAEAVRALCANYPDFYADLIASSEKGVAYKCIVDKEQIGEDMLNYPMSRSFSITPVVTGAGKIGKIILGVALIVAGLTLKIPTLTVNGVALFSATTVVMLGVALTLGGIAQLLAPVPKNEDGKKQDNGIFDGPVNVTAQGAPIPIGYGRLIVGSVVASAGITVQAQSQWGGVPGGVDGFMNNFNVAIV